MKVHHVPISQSVEGIELGKGQEGGFNPGEIPEDSSGKVLKKKPLILMICTNTGKKKSTGPLGLTLGESVSGWGKLDQTGDTRMVPGTGTRE
jgi:hypothetical protein